MLTQSLAAAANRAVIDSFVHSSRQFLFYKSAAVGNLISSRSLALFFFQLKPLQAANKGSFI